MKSKQRVYHGLNKKLFFQKFTAYFNQPISTTTSYSVAQQFSTGVGIILSLKSGSESGTNSSKIPKYLSVSWLSDFPNEDELLFYGDNVVFKIHDIIEGHSNVGHAKELSMLNEFQKVIQNQYIVHLFYLKYILVYIHMLVHISYNIMDLDLDKLVYILYHIL